MDPSALLAQCNLQSTDAVADFGAGSGFGVRAASKLVPQGNVFAIEIHRDIVTRLVREVAEMNITNGHCLWGDIEILGGSQLGDASMDFVIISNVLFHLDDKEGCAKEAFRVLKKGGRLLLVDWTDSFGGMGPSAEHVFSAKRAEVLFTGVGFSVIPHTVPAGDHHYAILFKK